MSSAAVHTTLVQVFSDALGKWIVVRNAVDTVDSAVDSASDTTDAVGLGGDQEEYAYQYQNIQDGLVLRHVGDYVTQYYNCDMSRETVSEPYYHNGIVLQNRGDSDEHIMNAVTVGMDGLYDKIHYPDLNVQQNNWKQQCTHSETVHKNHHHYHNNSHHIPRHTVNGYSHHISHEKKQHISQNNAYRQSGRNSHHDGPTQSDRSSHQSTHRQSDPNSNSHHGRYNQSDRISHHDRHHQSDRSSHHGTYHQSDYRKSQTHKSHHPSDRHLHHERSHRSHRPHHHHHAHEKKLASSEKKHEKTDETVKRAQKSGGTFSRMSNTLSRKAGQFRTLLRETFFDSSTSESTARRYKHHTCRGTCRRSPKKATNAEGHTNIKSILARFEAAEQAGDKQTTRPKIPNRPNLAPKSNVASSPGTENETPGTTKPKAKPPLPVRKTPHQDFSSNPSPVSKSRPPDPVVTQTVAENTNGVTSNIKIFNKSPTSPTTPNGFTPPKFNPGEIISRQKTLKHVENKRHSASRYKDDTKLKNEVKTTIEKFVGLKIPPLEDDPPNRPPLPNKYQLPLYDDVASELQQHPLFSKFGVDTRAVSGKITTATTRPESLGYYDDVEEVKAAVKRLSPQPARASAGRRSDVASLIPELTEEEEFEEGDDDIYQRVGADADDDSLEPDPDYDDINDLRRSELLENSKNEDEDGEEPEDTYDSIGNI